MVLAVVGSGAGRRRRRVARLVWISQRSRASTHCTRARVLDHSSDSPMERRAPHGAVEMHTRASPHKCVQRCSRHRSRGLSRSGPSGKRVDGVPARPHPRPSRNAYTLDSPAPLPSPAPFPRLGTLHPYPRRVNTGKRVPPLPFCCPVSGRLFKTLLPVGLGEEGVRQTGEDTWRDGALTCARTSGDARRPAATASRRD